MKLILVRPGPHFSVQDVADGWAAAFTDLLGSNFGDFNLDRRMDFYDIALTDTYPDKNERWEHVRRLALKGLEAACYEFKPDVLFVVSGFHVDPVLIQLVRSYGTKVVLLATESPYIDDTHRALANHYDMVLLNDPVNLDRFENAHYFHHSYDPAKHFKRTTINPEWVSDFCFVGTGYPERIEFFEAVDWAGLDVAFGGNWQALTDMSPLRKFLAHDINNCLNNADAHDLYSGTKASANFYRTQAESPDLSDGWAMSPREVELAAAGCFYLTQERGENREVLPMVPTFVGPDDFGVQLRYWLTHDSARERVAAQAREAIAERTFHANAQRMLRLVGS